VKILLNWIILEKIKMVDTLKFVKDVCLKNLKITGIKLMMILKEVGKEITTVILYTLIFGEVF
jgi:hypothetical protein